MAIKGRLKDIGIIDVLQILHAEKKTATLYLGSEKGYGKIYLKGGEIVHAGYRDSAGIAALYNLLSWKEGDFDVEAGETIDAETIKEDFSSIMKESVKRFAKETEKGKVVYAEDMESVNLIKKLLELGILEKVA